MKKIIAIILTIALAFSFCTLSASADSAAMRPRNISAEATTDAYKNYLITELWEDSKISKSVLTVADDEILIVKSGVTLRLYKGAQVRGAIYIENGGSLYISGGTLTVSKGGSVLSDGLLYVRKQGKLSIKIGGELFVGKSGRLKAINEGDVTVKTGANAVCLGKSNIENSRIGRKAVAAYTLANGELSISEKPSSLLPSGKDYCTDFTFQIGVNLSTVTYIFDNGASVNALKCGKEFAYIGSACTAMYGMYTKNAGNSYCRVFEVNGSDYIIDMEKGGCLCTIDKSGILLNESGKKLNGIFGKFNKNSSKSIGDIRNYFCGGKEEIISADAYYLSDDCILVMEKLTDSVDKNGKQQYSCYILSRVENDETENN